MEKITSTSNEFVKKSAALSQKKYRQESGLFLAEGEKAVEGLFNSEFNLKKLFLSESKIKNFDYINGEKIIVVNEAILSKISTTKTPCDVIGLFEQKQYNISDFIDEKRILLLENIKDAGNLGTILRTCKAFNIGAVLLLGDTTDLYNPKVVRDSVGCFDLPVLNIDYKDLSKFKNHKIYSTALYENAIPLNNLKCEEPLIIAFGAEADGLTREFLKNETINFNIETSNKVESLNLASAVTICLYKLFL